MLLDVIQLHKPRATAVAAVSNSSSTVTWWVINSSRCILCMSSQSYNLIAQCPVLSTQIHVFSLLTICFYSFCKACWCLLIFGPNYLVSMFACWLCRNCWWLITVILAAFSAGSLNVCASFLQRCLCWKRPSKLSSNVLAPNYGICMCLHLMPSWASERELFFITLAF